MPSDSEEDVWRRRERSLAGGIILWAMVVTAAATLRPETVADVLMATHSFKILGGILASIGLAGGFVDFFHIAVRRWVHTEKPDIEEVQVDDV